VSVIGCEREPMHI